MTTKMLLPERQCDGKQRWVTRAKALGHKAALGHEGIDVYRCVWCGGWHIGHSVHRRKPYKRTPFRWDAERT